MKPTKLLASCLIISALTFSQTPQTHSRAAKNPSQGKAKSAQRPDSPLAIHQSALIIDTHADTPQRFLDEHFDLSQDTPVSDGHEDLGKIKKGNLAGEFFSIWVEPDFKGHYAKRAMDLIDSVYQQAARHPDKMTMAFTAADIVRARQQ